MFCIKFWYNTLLREFIIKILNLFIIIIIIRRLSRNKFFWLMINLYSINLLLSELDNSYCFLISFFFFFYWWFWLFFLFKFRTMIAYYIMSTNILVFNELTNRNIIMQIKRWCIYWICFSLFYHWCAIINNFSSNWLLSQILIIDLFIFLRLLYMTTWWKCHSQKIFDWATSWTLFIKDIFLIHFLYNMSGS